MMKMASTVLPHGNWRRRVWCTLLVLLLVRQVAARPPWLAGSVVLDKDANCNRDEELIDLCQRCAKITKSLEAYPACCSTDMEARKWCTDYVYFGKGHYD